MKKIFMFLAVIGLLTISAEYQKTFAQDQAAEQTEAVAQANDEVVDPFAAAPNDQPIHQQLKKLFIDGGISFGSVKDSGTIFSMGLRPGIAISLTEEVSFVAHIGFLGFENFSPKGEGKSGTNFGLDFSNSCSFGVYYNF